MTDRDDMLATIDLNCWLADQTRIKELEALIAKLGAELAKVYEHNDYNAQERRKLEAALRTREGVNLQEAEGKLHTHPKYKDALMVATQCCDGLRGIDAEVVFAFRALITQGYLLGFDAGSQANPQGKSE
jgi:hypothetical protein